VKWVGYLRLPPPAASTWHLSWKLKPREVLTFTKGKSRLVPQPLRTYDVMKNRFHMDFKVLLSTNVRNLCRRYFEAASRLEQFGPNKLREVGGVYNLNPV
jgi:hypothetical protein